MYDKIARNFDIFEFIDENIAMRNYEGEHTPKEEASDELEFEINPGLAESLDQNYYDRRLHQERTDHLLDVEDMMEDAGTLASREAPNFYVRSSTQGTDLLYPNVGREEDIKLISPLVQSF